MLTVVCRPGFRVDDLVLLEIGQKTEALVAALERTHKLLAFQMAGFMSPEVIASLKCATASLTNVRTLRQKRELWLLYIP